MSRSVVPGRFGASALAAAAAEADVRGVPLTVVLVRPTMPNAPSSPAARLMDHLHQALRALAQQHPGLATTVDWPVSNWAQTLIHHSTHASLTGGKFGSHHSDDRWSIRVGPTAGAVLRQATGPIM